MNQSFRRAIELLQPALEEVPSGGNLYNRRLAEAAEARAIPLALRRMGRTEVGVHFREDSTHLRIWDSLFLEALVLQELTVEREWGLLLHYLPSLNPTLAEAERRRLASIEGRVLEAAPLVIVTGDALLTSMRRYRLRRPVCVCEPGVSAAFLAAGEKRPSASGRAIELLTVANMLPAKGLLELLVIFSALRDLPWRWHVVGAEKVDPEYSRQFTSTATALGLDGRISRHGPLDQNAVASLMSGMDVFVSASRFEAYGMALAEAAAAGLPAVTTDVGAASRLYRHGESGFLASPDDAASFMEYVRALITNAEMRERFRKNLRTCTPRTWQDTLDDFVIAIGTME